jgi:hypothetical protein
MNLPLEILNQIASYLNSRDLKSFRLVNCKFARVGISLIAHNGLSVLNTIWGFEEIRELLKCESIAVTTRELIIYHGAWPVCSRAQWEIHPLLFGGQSRIQNFQTAQADKAFADYSKFIEIERNRTSEENAEVFSHTLRLLPNLKAVTISHMQNLSWHSSRNAKYQALQRKIWITPYIADEVTIVAQRFLLALSGGFRNVTSLTIYGTLNPTESFLRHSGQFQSISTLCIRSLQVQENPSLIQNLLRSFPNLVEISLTFTGWSQYIPNVLGDVFWPHLKRILLVGLWASEDGFFNVFKSHCQTLEIFGLCNVTIVHGSWRSLFTQIRSLGAHSEIFADGELYGRISKNTLKMDQAALSLLFNFVKDKNFVWPFCIP